MSTNQNETTSPTPGEQEITYTIVTEVAAINGVPPTDLEPLASVIDPDALESLVGRLGRGSAGECFVQFDYCGCEVTVTGDGGVLVSEHDVDSF